MSKSRKREETPDLLGNLLTGGKARPEPEEVKRPAIAQTSSPDRETVKVTVYLSEDVAYSLDEAKATLRRLLKPESKHSVSKSIIVEKALALALRELQEQGIKSPLARAIDEE